MSWLNVRKFLERTCLPGFSEMYNAENRFWRIFWFVAVTFSFVMTGYLLVNATLVQFINQPTTTSIQPATKEDLLYLPFRMCYPHWLYWVDIDKALKMNFTKYGMLYGLSHLTAIYSSTKINETEAQENFHTQMAANNLSTVMDFYKAIVTEPEVFRNNDDQPLFVLTEPELYNYPTAGQPQLCHRIKGENIRTLLTDNTTNNWNRIAARRNELQFKLSYDYIADYAKYIDDLEYACYVSELFRGRFNFTGITGANSSLPLLFFPTPYEADGIILARDIDWMRITIKAAVNLWKSTKQSPCRENVHWVATNESCISECLKNKLLAEAAKPEISIPITQAVTINNYSVNISANDIVYLGKDDGESATVETITENLEQVEDDCNANCDGMKGCREYILDISHQETSFISLSGTSGFRRVTTVVVKYPKENEILVMKQEDTKTWQDFIGNVGGLLGIWTGASVIAFVQLFYLCCCSDRHGCNTSKMKSNKKSIKKLPPTTVRPSMY